MLKLVYQDVYLGGAETFLLRIGEFFVDKGINVTLYCEKIFSEEIKEEYTKAGINVFQSKNAPKEAFRDVAEEDIFLTISLYFYLECLVIKTQKKKANKLFYYVVHPYNSLHITRSKLLNRMTLQIYKNILCAAIESGTMFFMDEMCTHEFSRFYNMKNNMAYKIVYLPMKIVPLNASVIEQRIEERKRIFDILTIARSEFPFKGYIRDLIKIYGKLKSQNENCKLTIISSGRDIDKLKEWISDAIKDGVKNIELYENVSPSQLKKYYERASCYIGQGTTLLDACNYGVPALPIEAYTYELKSKGFFDEVQGCLGAPFGTGENAEAYVEHIIKMNDDEYRKLLVNCRNVFEKKYDIKLFSRYLTFNNFLFEYKVPYEVKLENYIRRAMRWKFREST